MRCQTKTSRRVIDRLVEKLAGEGYISLDEPGTAGGPWQASERPGAVASGSGKTEVRFEIADRSLDFLGYKTLRDLMGSLGKAATGRHDTREMATGIEASGSSKNYEFGDTLNLDVHATLARAIQRQGLGGAAGAGVFRLDGAPVGASKFLRHGADARLQPQHDSLR